jgi:hypothetical protein
LCVTAAAGYLMLKKATDWALSDALNKHLLNEAGIKFYVWTVGIILFLAILTKLATMLFEVFPVLKFKDIEPAEISQALHRINSEITDHIRKWEKEEKTSQLKNLKEQHCFSLNIRNLSDYLATHIKRAIVPVQIKNKDIFISLYLYDKSKNLLTYELHYDPKRDLVETRAIDLKDRQYENYICVKCINSNQKTAYVLKKEDYKKGHSKRYKTFKQYMGCKIENDDNLFGFLNIEFHNHDVFKHEEEMEDFMEKNVFPFKLLFEYQFLKKSFFNQLHELKEKLEAM